MKRYIGLDVHSKSCTFVVLNESGKTLLQQVVETNGRCLIEFLKLVPGEKYLCLEEGTQSQWLFEILHPHVEEVVVVHVSQKRRGQKNDALDATKLAEQLRTRTFETRVYKAKHRYGRLRALMYAYNGLVNDHSRTKNRIHAIFRSWGLPTEPKQLFLSNRRTPELIRLPLRVRKSAELLFFEFDVLADMVDEVRRELVKEAEKFPSHRILQSCPGIGPVRAAELMSIVITPHRFRTRRQYWAYAGFAVVSQTSSDWTQSTDGTWQRALQQRTRGLNQNRNGRLKHIYKGAATNILVFKPEPLYSYYTRQLEQGTNPNLAKVSLARKLAVITLGIWKRQEVYDASKL